MSKLKYTTFSLHFTPVFQTVSKESLFIGQEIILSGANPVVAEKTEKECAKGISILWCCKL